MKRIAAAHKVPGVCYAWSAAGIELPILDLTHPAFEFAPSAADLAALAETSLRALERGRRVPRFVQRWLARRSILLRGFQAAEGGALGALPTYLLKLGPANLGRGYASGLDRKLCGYMGAVATRLRVRDVARLLAEGLAPQLAARPGTPLEIVELGGGVAAGAWNALLFAHRAGSLAARETSIHILDANPEGPHFTASALAALTAPGAPLAGAVVDSRFIRYDWQAPAALDRLLPEIFSGPPVAAGCAEGSLFEYGTEEAIAAHLQTIGRLAPAGFFLVGSRMRAEPLGRAIHATSGMRLRFFESEAFAALVERAGWEVEKAVAGNPVYEVFRLRLR